MPEMDLSKSSVVGPIRDHIEEGYYGHLHFGIPCTTLTIVQYSFGGTRTAKNPWGDGSRPAEVTANRFIRAVFGLVLTCIATHTPFTIVNPFLSLLWHLGFCKRLVALDFIKRVDLDMCMYGLVCPGSPPPEYWNKNPLG